jgi:glucose-6-phosphate isomerase
MENISLELDKAYGFVSQDEIASCKKEMEQCNLALHQKTGKGNDFLGWVDLPSAIQDEDLEDIEKSVTKLQPKHIEIYVVIGIGGSYLGSKAVIDALSDSFSQIKGSFEVPNIVFAGQNISEDYFYELRDFLKVYALKPLEKYFFKKPSNESFKKAKDNVNIAVLELKKVAKNVQATDPKTAKILRQISGSPVTILFGNLSFFAQCGLLRPIQRMILEII